MYRAANDHESTALPHGLRSSHFPPRSHPRHAHGEHDDSPVFSILFYLQRVLYIEYSSSHTYVGASATIHLDIFAGHYPALSTPLTHYQSTASLPLTGRSFCIPRPRGGGAKNIPGSVPVFPPLQPASQLLLPPSKHHASPRPPLAPPPFSSTLERLGLIWIVCMLLIVSIEIARQAQAHSSLLCFIP